MSSRLAGGGAKRLPILLWPLGVAAELAALYFLIGGGTDVTAVDLISRSALLLRRMEIQVLALLGALHAGADWGAITGEHHSRKPASTALGREDHAFHHRRARP
jgi:hypothetical protein